MAAKKPWYAGEHQDALYYLLIAIFFLELIVGGVAFFYGIIHSAPEVPGGPPMARFPWLAWGIAAIMAPAGLLLIVHLAGSWLSGAMNRENDETPDDEHLPEGMRRFYASVRHAPTLVVLLGILLAGVGLFFMEGALGVVMELGKALMPHIPWIAGSAAALLSICFIGHAIMVYRQRKLEQEYAWRREVLEKTGLVLVDKASVALPRDADQLAIVARDADGPILDVDKALPPASGTEPPENNSP